MKSVLLSLLLATNLLGADRLLFEDDFDRNESQEKKDEIGKGWGSNSAKRAGGHKQVDLRDGAMYIFIHQEADHGVSVTHPAEFRDGVVETRFKLENPKDTLGLNFADLQYKGVHAGHLFKVTVGSKELQIADLKAGIMAKAIREAKLAKTLSKEQKDMLRDKTVKTRHSLELNTWYQLRVVIRGDSLSASIDGNEVLSFSSPGIGHPTKRMLRLAVPRQAVVDDLRIFASE